MSDSNHIKAVAFDLGNVLLPFCPFRAVFNISRVSGKNPFAIALFFLLFGHWQDFDRGKYTATEFYEICKKRLRLNISEKEFTTAFADMFRENTGVINLLSLLKERYKLVLMSDINPIHANFCFERYQFFKMFDEKILSYEVKVKKPSKKSFNILIERAGARPHEIVFVDDKYLNIKGARRYGIKGIHFRGEDKLIKRFRQMGLL